MYYCVDPIGIEPTTSALQGRRSPNWAKDPCIFISILWAWVDLNNRPHAYQTRALTRTELQAPDLVVDKKKY